MRTHRDEEFMKQCLLLARKGGGYVSPNPMVGAVIVQRGKILGTGYHKKFGGPHAEVYAIRAAQGNVRGATLYVNLEPCNFFGKTPPCTDLVITSGIARVVVGMKDPNPRVAGKGIRKLRKAGIEVVAGVLEDECRVLNESFTKYIQTGLPFVTMKIAQTQDGKIADESGHSKWITGVPARKIVHSLRSRVDAVLVGAHTVRMDDPRLTVRSVRGRSPARVVLDGRCTLTPDAKIFTPGDAKRIIAVSKTYSRKKPGFKKTFSRRGVEVLELDSTAHGKISPRELLQKLGEMGIASLLVEGGAEIYRAFLDGDAVDKLILFVAPRVMGKGLDALPRRDRYDRLLLQRTVIKKAGVDLMISGYLLK
ncbi:MAG TPA: bifunctional diaminohydroxyphosphoribosylaminopyrimidine deaminase/5-amino-6-(5-phosphoribosylamino)uracil reductase RibD [Bacteroidota bacterium]|jgi:diaminohydroxyphosphoribosylaminopyrimidine deaminase/5-amino-6-(5-phosphoribosylamino)uracil reductase|nr:bifunctional diaminohydroxyphosphoribosylaminopyrimidine deaminase/5-amino-6-(5-phosphoribosylamino)uracil reductase RibD [Bacteroidota bacterium]